MIVKTIFREKDLSHSLSLTVLGIIVLSLLISCGGSTGELPLVLPEKMPYNMAVVFSDEFNLAGGEHYSIGEALRTELFSRVGDVYLNTAEEFDIPDEGEYDRIITFALNEMVRDEHNRRLTNATDPSLPSRYIPLRYRISVTMSSYTGKDVDLIEKKVIKGIGESSSREGISIREGRGIASSSGRGSFDEAVAEAMESVCSDVTKLLIRGFAEPKNKSRTS